LLNSLIWWQVCVMWAKKVWNGFWRTRAKATLPWSW
jgi:hypothetical protein